MAQSGLDEIRGASRGALILRARDCFEQQVDDLEIASCSWVSWFNDERLHGELDDLTPAEVEDGYYRHQSQPTAA